MQPLMPYWSRVLRTALFRYVLIVIVGLFCTVGQALAITYWWRSAPADNVWTNPANWSTVGFFSGVNTGTFPGPADDATFGLLAETTAPITFTGIPLAGVRSINAATLQRVITIPAGETLTITGMGSDAGGNANITIAPGATMRILSGATVQGAGGAFRWNIVGTLELVGTGAVISSGMGFYPGSTLLYSGTAAKTTGFELVDGNTNAIYATGFPGQVIVSNTGGVTLNVAAATTHRFSGLITINAGASFIANPSGAFPIFQHEGGITVNGTLRLQETMDLRAGVVGSLVNVNAGGRLQVQGQATASSATPATPSIVYAGATSILEFTNGAASTASFGTVGTNHLVPATMPGSIIHNSNTNLQLIGGARVIQGDFTVNVGAGLLNVDATTDINLQGNIALNAATIGGGGNTGARFTISGVAANTISGTLSGIGVTNLFGLTMNRATRTFTLGSSFTFDGGGLSVAAGTVALVNAGTLVNTGLGINSVAGTLDIGAGTTFKIRTGTNFANTGTVLVSNAGAGGTLECEGDNNPNTRITGAGTYSYAGTAAKLNYTGGSASGVWEAGSEFPSPMPGTVTVIKSGNSTLFITSTKSMTGPMIVQSGFCSVITAGGNLTLGAGSQVQNGATFQAANGSTVSGGANLTVQTGGKLQFVFTPKATWTGTPTYQTNGVLEYLGSPFTTGAELPATMAGNISIASSGSAATLGASTILNGNLLLAPTPNNGTFTIASPNILTLAGAGNSIGNGASLVVNAAPAECVITTGGDLTNNGTLLVNGTLTMNATGSYNVASTQSPTFAGSGVLQYTGANPSYTTGKEFVGSPSSISSLVINRSSPTDVVILQNGKILSVNATITQGVLQTSAVGTSLGHTIAGDLTVAANGRLRVQENSSIGVAGTTSYSAATARLEYAGTTLKSLTGGELPGTFGGSILVNNSGGVNAPASTVTVSGTSFDLTLGNWKIPAGGGLVLSAGTGILNGSATSYVEFAPGANLSNAFLTKNGVSATSIFDIGTSAGYRPITIIAPSAAANITLGASAASPTGSTDNAPFIGSLTSPGYWYVSAASACNAQVRVSHPSVTAASKFGSHLGVNAGGAYNDVTGVVAVPNITSNVYNLGVGTTFFAIGTGPAATSDIVAATGPIYTYTAPILLAQFGAAANLGGNVTATSISLFEFDVRDNGGDGLPTVLNTLNFTLNDASGQLEKIALYDGATELDEITAVNGALSFTGLTLSIANATTKRLALHCTFKSNVTDNANVGFTITGAVANAATSTFAAFPALASSVAGNNNRVSVVATTLSFPNAVGNQIVNTNFAPSVDVRAVDVNNNLDLDAAGTVTLTGAPIAVSAGGAVVLGAGLGIATFSGVQMSGTGTSTLTATLAALTGVSNSFMMNATPTYWGCTPPSTPPALPILGIGGRNMNFSNVGMALAPAAPVVGTVSMNVNPGTAINMSFDWNMTWGAPYCPGCVVQMYIGIEGGSGFAGDGSSATGFTQCIGTGVSNGSMGSVPIGTPITFNAPTKPGIYYITQNWTLHYYCNPHPVRFNNDPTNAIAVIRVVDPIPPSGGCDEADIIPTPAFVPPTNIPYATYTGAMSAAHPAVWSFRIRDFGSIPTQGDIDNKPSTITSLGVTVNDVGGVLQEIALYDGAGLIQTQPVVSAGTSLVTFSGIPAALRPSAPDNGTKDYIIRARFRTTPLVAPMDNRQVSFSINQANVVMDAAAVSTQKAAFAVAGPSSTAGNNNRVEVTATQLAFTTNPPATTPVGVPMASAVVVQAEDGNTNIDLDYVAPNVAVAHPSLIGTPVSVAPVAGVATLPIFTFNNLVAAGTLNASSGGLTAGTSNAFDIIPATFHFKLATGNANLNTNWQLAGFPLVSPASVGLPGATYIIGSVAQDPAAANITAPLTVNVGSAFQVSGSAGGSTLNVLAGQTLTNDGAVTIQGGGRLQLHDNGNIAPGSANPVTYAAATSVLEYTGGVIANRTTNDREFPALFAGSLVVSRSAGAADFLLDGSKTIAGTFSKNAAGGMVINGAQTLTLNGASIVAAGTFNFLNTAQLVANNTFTFSGGTMLGDNTANLTFNGGFTNSGGAVTLNNAATLTFNSATAFNGTSLTSNGTGAITVGAGGSFTMTGAAAVNLASTGAMTSNGAFNLNGGAFGVGVSALTLNGAINFGAGTLSSPMNFGTLRVLGTGAITGQMNNLSPGYALVEMNRMNATLSLASGSSLVTNTLLLTNGIIQTNNTADIVSVTNTLTAAGSATTYISGKLRRALLPAVLNNAGTFDFPIGKGGLYLPMRFQNVTANSAVVQAEAFNIGSGGMPGSAFSTVSSSEYWQTSLQGGAFTSGLVSLSRPTPMLPSSSVVGHSATQTGSYNGLGGAVSPPSVLSFSPVLSANRFFALGTLPNAFYYNSGAAQIPASWNSEENGTGAPAIDFLTPGTSFIVPTGRNALFTAAATFVPGIFVTVNGGGTLTVRTGSDTVAVNGIMRVSNGGTLAIADSSRFIAPSGVFYLGQTAQLFYDTPANRTATSSEFPATMLGSVRVSNGRLRLETNANIRDITIQGALTLQNSTLDFGKDSTRLRLEGAISFNPSQFATNLTHGLTIAGSGSITGAINFSTKSLGWLTMQRTGVAMTLGDSLTIGSQLSLFGGNIVPSLPGIVRLTNSADTALLGGSFSSFIGGTLARALPTNLTPVDARSHFYPIGKGSTYLPLTLLNATTGSVSPIVAAEAFAVGAGGGVALGVNGALSSSEHWRVELLSGNFGGAQVGVIRPNPPFAADNRLVVSNIKTGLYNGLGGALLPIAQGASLVGDAAQISGERFFAAVGPTLSGPSITGFSPSIGGEQTVMTITGTNLTGVNAIAIGGINVAGFQVLSSTTISVQIGTVGSGPIQIGSPSGGAASGSNFTFIPAPRIFGALPNPAGLGVPVTISGANFTGANFLSIGGVQIPPTGFTVDMAGNTITTTIPLNAANQIITIATLGGTAISTNALVLIPPPQIMSINPPLASTGQTITLFGQNFIGVQTVRFGSSTAQFTVNSPTRITLIVPARESTSATQVPISVRTGSGIATTATLFAYNPLPNGTPNGLDPVRIVVISEVRDKITTLGGRVRVTGANLELIQQIKLITSIGSTNASWLISSSAAITLIIPTTGLLNGTNATLSSAATSMDVLGVYNRVVVNDAFRVINVPRILSVTPPDAAGGEEITLTGTAMDLITSVTIGGTAATFRILDSSRVVVRVPFSFSPDSVRIPASGALAVQSVDGGASTAATIINAALAGGQPVITSFSPTNAVPGGEVIITGLNLTAVQDIEVGGIPVASFVINSSNRITAILSTAASRSAQGIISLRTVFGVVNSRTAIIFPSSLEGDTNAANALIALLGGDSRRLQFETQNNRITALRLSNAGLRGPIPPVISTLTELRELDLSNNLLDGQLPTTLATLRKLEVLNLSNNRFSGVLTPGIICQYRNLRFMDVSRNNLTGEIPVCITELDKIETLNLSFNRFTSLLPWQLGAMVSLRELRVSNNMLTGALPPEIGTGGARVTAKAARTTRAPIVEVIDVSHNAFTGGIPEEWGNIPMLRELRAENCGLTGRLPETILRWQGINILRLAKNRLSGEIPSFFAENLKEFSIDNNRFTGALPTSFAKAAGLQVLSALGNRLTRIPNLAPLGRLVSSRLDTVLLDSNQLEFSSLEAFTRVKSFSANGQDLPKASDDVLATVGDILEIPSAIGGTATRYQWFKNGNSLRGATAATLVLSNIQVQDVGTYFCRATNTLVSNLTLQTAPVRVSVTGAAQSVPAPRLIFPSAASTNIAPRPSFRWQASAGADSYTLVVARDVALRTDVQSVSISSPEQGDSVVLAFARSAGRGTLLERGVQYFWSVRASSQLSDLLASWSDTLSFRIAPFGQDIAFSSVNLGRVTIGDSARASGTIVNIGEDDVTVESAQVESGMANVFALNFTRTRLAKDATATFDVLFKPDRADTIRANVTVAYSDARGQGMRSVSIERALTGRGGAIFIEPLSFDSVRVGKTVLKILRVSNRSNQPQTLRAVRMLTARGNTTDSTFVIVDGDANSNRVIGAGESAFVQVRCATRTGGFKLGVVEADAGNDRVQGDIRAYSRLVRSDDAAVSFVAQASPKEAAPGAAVRVDVVINDYSPALAQRLLGAAQPEVRLAVRFDRQVLVLDNAADGGSRLQRGASDTNVVIINARWDGRSRAVASMLCRAVAGSRTVTNLEIINAEWGSTSATVRPDWERRVFVEEPPKDIATAGTFTALVSNAGGKRLITSVDTSRKPTLSLVRPNPANDVVSLTYKLMENSAPVSLDVLNMRGEVVQSLFAGISQTEGEYSLTVNARGLPVGSYMLRLRANQDMVTQRLDVMR